MKDTKMTNTTTQVAVLISEMTGVSKSLEDIKQSIKELNNRFDDLDRRQTSMESKVSGLAIMQSVFTIIASSIAAFLGGRKL